MTTAAETNSSSDGANADAVLVNTTATTTATTGAIPTGAGSGSTGPTEVPSGMEAEAALLTAFSEVPTVNRAVVRQTASGNVLLTATLQQRNLFGNAQRRYNVTCVLQPGAVRAGGEGPVEAVVGLPQEVSGDILMVSVAPSGSQQLVVLKGHNDTTAALLQLWRGARLAMELAVPKTLHGPLVNDGYFASGAAWAEDESAVVYTAETPAPERTPDWYAIGGKPPAAASANPATAAGGDNSNNTKAAAAAAAPGGGKGGNGSSAAGAAPRTWKGVGQAVEDWGELNTGKRPPAPYVLDLVRREVLKVPGLPAEHSVGQPTWCPAQPPTTTEVTDTTANPNTSTSTTTTTTSSSTGGGPSGLVFVAWPHQPPPSFPRLAAAAGPRKLGVVFCYNRSAHLYHIAVQRTAEGSLLFGPSATRLVPSLESALSPAFSPGGDALVFVSHQEAVQTGTHGGTGRLYRLDWSPQTGGPASPEPRLLVDIVQRPTGPSAFPGLYTVNIPEDGFVGPNTLLLNTQWGAVTAIVALDVSKTVGTGSDAVQPSQRHLPIPLTPVDTEAAAAEKGAASVGSWSLLGVAGGLMVAARVAPNCPSELYVAALPNDPASLTAADSAAASLRWRPVGLGSPSGDATRSELPPAVQGALDNLEFSVLKVQPRLGVEADNSADPFDCLVWRPRDMTGSPRPAVIAPHGGPHTAVTLGWYPPYAYLTALGYVVLSPNYRGSTGYGQAALASLPGAIGRQDVDDCMAALEAAVAAGFVDPSSVSIVGGSHGGFLTAHLLGQHPAAFRSGVMRNPVTNISAMIAASDIPDWCYVEVMGCEAGRRRCSPVPSPADLAAMYDASPVVHADRVTAPVFMMLGARDRRVPPPDGLQYLTALRGRDVAAAGPPPPTRLIVFPEDSHGLDKPQTEYEQWLNAAWWIKMYGIGGQQAAAAAAAAQEQTQP